MSSNDTRSARKLRRSSRRAPALSRCHHQSSVPERTTRQRVGYSSMVAPCGRRRSARWRASAFFCGGRSRAVLPFCVSKVVDDRANGGRYRRVSKLRTIQKTRYEQVAAVFRPAAIKGGRANWGVVRYQNQTLNRANAALFFASEHDQLLDGADGASFGRRDADRVKGIRENAPVEISNRTPTHGRRATSGKGCKISCGRLRAGFFGQVRGCKPQRHRGF